MLRWWSLSRRRAAVVGDRVHRLLFAVLFRGTRVTCPLCGWSGRWFFRGNQCPRCRSLARHRLVPYALGHFEVARNPKVLIHAGPNHEEREGLSRYLSPGIYVALDNVRRNKGWQVVADLRFVPFAEGTVDCVLAWHVLEHIEDDRAVIAEMYRVLKPGGAAVISVPIYPPGRPETFEDASVPERRREEVYGHPGHVRACGLDYGERFAQAGFKVRTLRVADLAADGKRDEIRRYGLSGSHVAWACSKER